MSIRVSKVWKSAVIVVFLTYAATLARSQDQNPPQQTPPEENEPQKPTLKVEPGHPVIKDTELERKPVSPWIRMPHHILADQKAIWTSPFHTSRENAKWWAIGSGITAGLLASDEWASKQLPNTKSQYSIAKGASYFGAMYVLMPSAFGLYTAGAIRKRDRLRETGLLAMEAMIDSGIVVEAFKIVTDRQRPYEGTGEGNFWQSRDRPWNASFPSGHAIETWTMASVIAHEYPHPRIIPILVYSYAMGVNGARFAAHEHFASDIIVGAVIGWFIGDYAYAKRHNPEIDQEKSAFHRVLSHIHIGGMPPAAGLPRGPG